MVISRANSSLRASRISAARSTFAARSAKVVRRCVAKARGGERELCLDLLPVSGANSFSVSPVAG
jgi:hypothetical protein